MSAVRKTAIVVGVLFLVQTISYLSGDALVRSGFENLSNPNTTQVRLGVFLQFVNTAAVIGIGVLLFPILRRFHEGFALGYTATKIMEAALLLVSAAFALLTIADPAPNEAVGAMAIDGYDLTFQLAMVALGAGSLFFMYLLYRFKLVPRPLSLLGVVGYVALFGSGWFEIAGVDNAMILYIPGGLFELILPLWLITKGFSEPLVAPESSSLHGHGSPAPDRETRATGGSRV